MDSFRIIYKILRIVEWPSKNGASFNNDAASAKTPMETMTKGRVYVTVDNKNNLSAITYYDKENKRKKQIDLHHPHKKMMPHTHHGYLHNEYDSRKGAAKLTTEEKTMVDRIYKIWHNRIDR